MKKILFFILLFFCYPSYSQMVDLLGSLSIQGALTAGDAQSVSMGLSELKKNQILQDIIQTATEIKTQFMGNYNYVGKSSVYGQPFKGIDWDLSSLSSNLFYIQLNHIDKKTCSTLLSARIPAVYKELNGNRDVYTCSDINQIRFIFD